LFFPEINGLTGFQLKPTSDKINEIQTHREAQRRSQFFNHLSAISESIPALGWVSIVSSRQCGRKCFGKMAKYFPINFEPRSQSYDYVLNLQLQRQRCSRLERFSKYNKNLFSKRARLPVAL
jgi:hypothetical protein